MRHLILSTKIYIWANVFVAIQMLLLANPMNPHALKIAALAISFSLVFSFPAIILLLLFFTTARRMKVPVTACWLLLFITCSLLALVAALFTQYITFPELFVVALVMGLIGSMVAVLLHQGSIHELFKSYRYEKEY